MNNFLNNHNPSSANKPKAFINYILLDEQFNYVSGGASPVDDNPYTLKNHYPELQNIPVTKNGYLYVYASNESPVDVFFDNVQVVHTRGRILEENHYYSYGLKIAGISSKAAGSTKNNYLYQGDYAENDEETGLDEFDLRHYDPQIGRWTTADPYDEFANPYLGMGNNPTINVDPTGGLLESLFEGMSPLAKVGTKALLGAIIGVAIDLETGGDGLKGLLIGGGIGLASSINLSSADVVSTSIHLASKAVNFAIDNSFNKVPNVISPVSRSGGNSVAYGPGPQTLKGLRTLYNIYRAIQGTKQIKNTSIDINDVVQFFNPFGGEIIPVKPRALPLNNIFSGAKTNRLVNLGLRLQMEQLEQDPGKTLNDLVPGSIKRSPSWNDSYGDKTPKEIIDLAKKGDRVAQKMKKLWEQSKRLLDKNKSGGRK